MQFRAFNARLAALACLLTTALPFAAGAGPVEDRIREQVQKHTKGRVVAQQVTVSPVPGIYEVLSAGEIFYIDATGRYGFVEGRLVDLQTERDLTAARLDQLTRVDFGKLPLELAVRQVRGNGRRVMAVFEDPACPACRALHKFIAGLDDVTVYHFMYPVTDPNSVPKARAAWCSGNRTAAWSRLMNGGEINLDVAPCNVDGLQRIVTLGDQLNLVGTPVVFLANGRRLVGATPPEQFLAALDESAATTVARRP